MRILIVAATAPEIEKLTADLRFADFDCDQCANITPDLKTAYNGHDISILITGAGMVATAFAMGKHLSTNKYELAINLGIAGSFDRNIALGEVVEIAQDTFAELGAEDEEDFISIDELGFGKGRFTSSYGLPESFGLKKASAITVNMVHGNETSIQKMNSRIDAQIESMEGAAFFYACEQMGISAMQIRAVSNYVEKRNRDAWQIGPAIKNLNTFASKFLMELKVES